METIFPLCPPSPTSFSQNPSISQNTLTPRSPHLPLSLPLRSPTLPKLPSETTLSHSQFDEKLILLHSLGVPFTAGDLRRASGMCPDLLSAPSSLLFAAVSFLLSDAGVASGDLPALLRRRPRLLLSSVGHRLRPSLFFLLSLNLTPISNYASFLSFSVEEKFLPRIEFLQGLGFSHKEARSMVRRFPSLFCYSIEGNLRPKSEFLLNEMKRDLQELREFPDFYSFSLENRIKPRHEMCEQRGVKLSLPAMLRPGELRFKSRLEDFVGSAPPVRDSPLWLAGFDLDLSDFDL